MLLQVTHLEHKFREDREKPKELDHTLSDASIKEQSAANITAG